MTIRWSIMPAAAAVLLFLATFAAPAGAVTTASSGAVAPPSGIRSAAQLAGDGAVPAGCAGPAAPGAAHCYLAAQPAPAAAALAGARPGCVVNQQDGWSPCDLHSAYKIGNETTRRGKNQTIALIDAFDDPDAASDLATFRSTFNIPACGSGCFEKVNQEGVQGSYPTGDMGWGLEISADLDMVSAVCPLCHLLLVEADSNSFSDLFAAEQEAVSLGANVVSLSWGSGEFSTETSDDQNFSAKGVAFTVSSGDGAYQAGTQYPAASPDVTSVGGTELIANPGNTRGWSEKTWVTAGSSPPTQGAGSGCSAYEAKPAWQKDTGCGNRTTADVSAVATNVLGYDSFESGGGGWFFLFGTSLSAPIVAGMYGLAQNADGSVPPPELPYHRVKYLFDITQGLATGTCSPQYLCKAAKGYDGPTGLGTPKSSSAF